MKKVFLKPAKVALDLGDGSERAQYVNQDYILRKLGRPHRCVNIMYTYYPKDKEWPARISEACKDMNVSFAWDYPYDDYFPYRADGEPFNQMRDIRRHGQDVLLTLTIDCSLGDDELRKIAKELKPFGRMKIRINHECVGDWFTHNKRFTHAEIADFFIRFHNIIKEEAPNVSTVFCAGMMADIEIEEDGKKKTVRRVDSEEEYMKVYEAADVWSTDKYIALHYGWPYNIAEKGGEGHCHQSVDETYSWFKELAQYLEEKTGRSVLTSAEFNADGDVTGPFHQGDPVVRFFKRMKEEETDFLKAISLYQFRDKGRLGLEIEDPNNPDVGIEQPLLKEYKAMLNDPFFSPFEEKGEDVVFPASTRWGSSEDAEGIVTTLTFEKTPEFCEVTCDEDKAMMINFAGMWFYKAVGVSTIDLMSYFFENPLEGKKDIDVSFYVTPVNGENVDDGSLDWNMNYRGTIESEPKFRIRYEVPALVE